MIPRVTAVFADRRPFRRWISARSSGILQQTPRDFLRNDPYLLLSGASSTRRRSISGFASRLAPEPSSDPQDHGIGHLRSEVGRASDFPELLLLVWTTWRPFTVSFLA